MANSTFFNAATPNELEIQYILYTSYNPAEQGSYNQWRNGQDIRATPMYKKLEEHLQGLNDLLTYEELPGMLVMFIPLGWAELTQELERGVPIRKSRLLPGMLFSKQFKGAADQLLHDHGLMRRVRVITPLDIYQALWNQTGRGSLQELNAYFCGRVRALRYDAPKIPEAMVRLRLIGTGLPVLRLDHDVLFTRNNKSQPDLGLFKPIQAMVNASYQRETDPRIVAWAISGGYEHQALTKKNRSDLEFEDLANAFATRIYPALRCHDSTRCFRQGYRPSTSKRKNSRSGWLGYCDRGFNIDTIEKFLGVEITPTGVESNGGGLTRIGAHPTGSLVSGALLCLNSSAILDLPPFSSFSKNVMWIDDHLKYALHKSLRHLASVPRSRGRELASRIKTAIVCKERELPKNVPRYTTQVYIPSLVRGSIMDYWIQPDPTDKARQGAGRWPKRGVLTALLRLSLRRGDLPDKVSWNELQVDGRRGKRPQPPSNLLEAAAMTRLRHIYGEWKDLKVGSGKTFAAMWARGEVPRTAGLYRGLIDKKKLTTPLRESRSLQLVHIHQEVRKDIDDLITDALRYVRFVLEWPRLVRLFRSADQGGLHSDLGWPRRAGPQLG